MAAIPERHEISYIIVFGTLLGAVRHRGFIPWDDDFDFHLFEDTYAHEGFYRPLRPTVRGGFLTNLRIGR